MYYTYQIVYFLNGTAKVTFLSVYCFLGTRDKRSYHLMAYNKIFRLNLFLRLGYN